MYRSYRYSLLLPALALLLSAGALSGQRQSSAQLTAVIPAILKLETVSTGGTIAQDRGYTEVLSAVVLRVRANCRWRLVAVGTGDALGVRVAVRQGDTAGAQGYTPLRAGPKQLASGGPSDAYEVVVDYRVPRGADPAPIAYELQPAD